MVVVDVDNLTLQVLLLRDSDVTALVGQTRSDVDVVQHIVADILWNS